jgi:hypothetical protein
VSGERDAGDPADGGREADGPASARTCVPVVWRHVRASEVG